MSSSWDAGNVSRFSSSYLLVLIGGRHLNVCFFYRYPEKTMRLVAQLSNGVADEHREKMKTKLQRTFVQASDAASTKVKGRSNCELVLFM